LGDDDELQEEILISRSMGYFTLYGPLILSSRTGLEEKALGSLNFNRIVAHRLEGGYVQLSATVDTSVSPSTEGKCEDAVHQFVWLITLLSGGFPSIQKLPRFMLPQAVL